jgi:hypothetical protein
MQTYAIINGSDVINIIEYESQPSNPPPGFDAPIIAVQSDVASPGWRYENGAFVDTTPPPLPAPPIVTLTDMILANPDELAKLKLALGL